MKKRLVSFLFVLVLLCAAMSVTAFADSPRKCGPNLIWEYNSENKTLYIRGSGAMRGYGFNGLDEDYGFPEWESVWGDYDDWWYWFDIDVEKVVVANGVTSIGDYAFYGLSSLKSVTIADSVTSLGDKVFNGCTALEEIYIPADIGLRNAKLFSDCQKLSTIKSSMGDNVRCSFSIETGVLTFWGTGSFPKYESIKILDTLSYEVKEIVIENEFTEISKEAFAFQNKLEKITLPESLEYIGDDAFYDCRNLKSVDIPSVTYIGDRAFYDCYELSSVHLPESLKTIGAYAFYGCWSLTSIDIPDSVQIIENGAFCECISIAGEITIPASVTSIGKSAFKECTLITGVNILGPVTYIGDYAFYYCESVTSINIPDTVTYIGDWAFAGVSVTNINIPDTVTYIGEAAFYNCESVTSITLSDSVTEIRPRTFWGCKAVIIPENSIISISCEAGMGAIYYPGSVDDFLNNVSVKCYDGTASHEKIGMLPPVFCEYSDGKCCGALGEGVSYVIDVDTRQLTLSGTGTIVGQYVIDGTGGRALYEDVYGTSYPFKLCTNYTSGSRNFAFESVVIEEGIQGIGRYAFQFFSKLLEVTIPDSVTSIEEESFSCCSSLKSITIPDGVTSIGHHAFLECESLTSVTIPNLVTDISYAFQGCKSLTSITIPDSVTEMDGAFKNCYNLTSIVIPDSVTTIGQEAFYSCMSLTSVTIPDSVTVIENDVFVGCNSLTSITIPDSVTEMYDAFDCCDALETVYYYGTPEQWDALISGMKSSPLLNAKVVFKNGAVEPTPTPPPEVGASGFTDVADNAWYAAPVLWAKENNVTGGTSATTFGPDDSCTRAQVVTFLWAANGKPEPKSMDNPFKDVADNAWYLKPVLWAVEQGITGGVAEGKFGPDQTCTRAQIATFLYAANGKPAVSGTSEFADVKDTDWFAKPIIWAAENGVTGGIGDGKFGPNNTCTRAQVVTFLYKVYGNK